MHVQVGGNFSVDRLQELLELDRAVAGAQAVEFLAPLEPGPGVRATRAAVRELSPRLRDDRSLASDIEAVAVAIRDGSIAAAAETQIGELR
jgi:histidine ammonia-lyase